MALDDIRDIREVVRYMRVRAEHHAKDLRKRADEAREFMKNPGVTKAFSQITVEDCEELACFLEAVDELLGEATK